MLKGCTFDNQNVTSQNDGGLYQTIFPQDGILWGCSMSVTTDTLTIQPGEMMIGGRLIWVDGATSIQLSDPIANGYGQLVLEIDLSQTSTQDTFNQVSAQFVYSTTTTFPELTQGDINEPGGDMIYQQQLAVVTISGSNITGITSQLGNAVIDAEMLGGKLPNEYATATQGAKADAAMPKSGGTFTGTVTSRALTPYQNNTYNMGSSDKRYKDIYCFSQHVDSLLTFDNAALDWKNIRAFTTIGFRKYDAPGTKINIDAANCAAPSSVRYKENIQDVSEEDALQILKLRPVSFDWKKGSGYDGGSKSFIAEEAAQIDERYVYRTANITKPEESHIDEKTGERVIDVPAEYEMVVEGLNQNPILCDLVALCQRQQRQIDALSALLVEKGILTQEEIDGLEG